MKKSIYLALAIVSMMLFSSCRHKGCTDVIATNYCDKCKKNDGSCTYQAKAIFWYNQATADSLNTYGITSLVYYVDGSVIGSSAANVYWSGAPTCGQSGSVGVTKSLGNSPSKSFSYSVKDNSGNEIWAGTLNLNAKNSCLETQLAW